MELNFLLLPSPPSEHRAWVWAISESETTAWVLHPWLYNHSVGVYNVQGNMNLEGQRPDAVGNHLASTSSWGWSTHGREQWWEMERDQVLMTFSSTWIQQNPKPDAPLFTQIRAVKLLTLGSCRRVKSFKFSTFCFLLKKKHKQTKWYLLFLLTLNKVLRPWKVS